MSLVLEGWLRRDRFLVVLFLAVVNVLAWGYTLGGAGMNMTAMEMTAMGRMDNMPVQIWGAPYALLMFFMWWVMMAAMMVPSATPTILLAANLNRSPLARNKPFGGAAFFTLGYLLGWGGFSILATYLQWQLGRTDYLSGMLQTKSDAVTAGLLIVAGVWQFTPWKQACLRLCRSPVDFLVKNKRPGALGAVIMGGHHSLFCLGCCWFLMLLLFVGGVMNLYWIIGLTAYVAVEKLFPGSKVISYALGALLLAWGCYVGLS